MNVEDRRFIEICIKWAMVGSLVAYCWHIGLFVVLFVWLPWLLQYEADLIMKWGLEAVVVHQAAWWVIAGVCIAFLLLFEYSTHYRHKRRDFRIGGEFEGRVVWIKGVRQGLVYDVWDFKNYLSWKMGKKKGGASPTVNSEGNLVISPGTWPDPWAIPFGDRVSSDYIIYYKRSFLQIVPTKVYLPRDYDIVPSFFNYWLPNLRMISEPHPDKPGLFVYRLLDVDAEQFDQAAAEITAASRKALGRSEKLVGKGILSDAETQKTDFTHGSFSISQLSEKEEVYD